MGKAGSFTRAAALIVLLSLASSASADIYNWQTGEVIPGTEGITPGPYVDLSDKSLHYAALDNMNFFNADFSHSSLVFSNLSNSALNYANLRTQSCPTPPFMEPICHGRFFVAAPWQMPT